MPGPARSFDWTAAERLRADGVSTTSIGRAFGVTHSAVVHATNPTVRERANRRPRGRRPRVFARQTWYGHCRCCGAPRGWLHLVSCPLPQEEAERVAA